MEANVFKAHFREFEKIAQNNTKYTKQGKPIISLTDPDFNDLVWNDRDEAGCDDHMRSNNKMFNQARMLERGRKR